MEHDENTEPSPQSAGDARPPRRAGRRIRRILLALMLILGVGLVAAPPLAGKWLRREILTRAGERIDGKVTLEAVQVSLNGKVRLVGLEVRDREGVIVAWLPSVRFDLGVRSMVIGKKDVALHVDGAEFELVRGEEGRWNVQDLLLPLEPDTGESPEPTGPLPREPYEVHGRLELAQCKVVLRSPDTVLQLRDLRFTVGLDGKVKETAVELEASLFGGEGSVGDFEVDMAVWPDAGPGLRLDRCGVTALDLGAAAEALALFGMPLEEGSVLAGAVDVNVTGRIDDLDPSAPFAFRLDAGAKDLLVDLRSGGLQTLAFDDPDARLGAHITRASANAEPRADLEVHARGDRLTANATWDAGASPGFVADVHVVGLNASAGLEPLLARVHPAFASAHALDGANLDALISSEVQIEYDAPLSVETLKGGWSALPKEPFRGTGSLGIDEGIVRTSPFFAKLLEAFGEPANPTFDLGSLGFAVDAGRIRYTDPWNWTIEGTETSFLGSVGLDQSLSLKWVVPITGGLARQNRVLESLEGESFEVGLGGTLTKPTFDLRDTLSSLTKRAAERTLQRELERQKKKLGDKLGDQLGDRVGGEAGKVIDDVLGGKAPEKILQGVIGAGAGVEDLLKEADRLWGEGKKAEAAKIYTRIRNDFPFSPTYLLNKSRVKERRGG